MPSLIDIRRRIRSVKNTQQITRALKMVSSAKLRRAQSAVIAARPYDHLLRSVLANLAASAASDDGLSEEPLLAVRPEKRIQVLLFTSDTGRCGAFNANLAKASVKFMADHRDAEIEFELIGRRGYDFHRKRGSRITGEHLNILSKPRHADAAAIARKVMERFRNGEIDAVYVLNNDFKSVLSQTLNLARILPVTLPEGTESQDYIFEQSPVRMIGSLLPRYIEMAVYRAMLETVAGEHAARMTAMDAATKNAGDVIDTLTLNMNRIRQASITKEIIEVVSGAAAAN